MVEYEDMNISEEIVYTMVRSHRRTLGLEIRHGEVIVRAPYTVSASRIEQFVSAHEKWIRKHLAESQKESSETVPLSAEEIQELARKALKLIPERVAHYAPVVGVTYGRITIRCQRTKWGSCSAKGNLNFNCLLMLTPLEVIDSIVVHELCHRKEMNHSSRFYAEVYRAYPDYDRCHKWLKDNGGAIMARAYDN